MNEWRPVIGKAYNINFGKGNPNNKKIHVLAVVDEDYYVCKYWQKYKQRWNYNVEHVGFLQLLYGNKYLHTCANKLGGTN